MAIQKRRSVISFHNLPFEIQEAVKEKYPLGYTDYMIRVDKPSGDFFYAVPFETDEVSYLVKVDVKIDDGNIEEEEKDYFNDEIKGADEIADTEDEEDD
ncbi:MAG: hypothetical protein J6K90_05525 [Tidjanibacter sp.]|nr:hypothetical protein [Tidjanibacter sp.]